MSVEPALVHGDDWFGVDEAPIPLAAALEWATLERCGAVVTFSGTVRDHSQGRDGVVSLTYECYAEHAVSRLAAIAAEARARWPELGRVVLLHRTGELALRETSVVVIVSAPHRAEAFEAAHWCIDTVKQRVPIWKRERWSDGEDWATCTHALDDVGGSQS